MIVPCGASGQAPHYLIRVATDYNGNNIFIEYPTFHGGNDFIWHTSDDSIKMKLEYVEVASMVNGKWLENPEAGNKMLLMLERYHETGVAPSIEEIDALDVFETGISLRVLVPLIGIGYIEQMNKNHAYLGTLLMNSLMFPSRERVAKDIQMCRGRVGLRQMLYQDVTAHMSCRPFIKSLEKRLVYKNDKDAPDKVTCDFYNYKRKPTYFDYTLLFEWVLALGKNYSRIFLQHLIGDTTGLHLMAEDENHDADAVKYWFENDIALMADRVDGDCAYFKDGYVRILEEGRVDICLYQDWTKEELVKTFSQKKYVKHHTRVTKRTRKTQKQKVRKAA
jgi:hypothetical protein